MSKSTGVLLCAILILCTGADIPCAPRPMDKTTWWTYRVINGKACWYRGKRIMSKNELYWEELRSPSKVGQPGGAMTPPPSVAEPTFERTWRKLIDDLNAALWLSTTPATQWSIGDRQ